jgi:hypothetical protein
MLGKTNDSEVYFQCRLMCLDIRLKARRMLKASTFLYNAWKVTCLNDPLS